jgi:hypothetical protein
MRWIATMLVCVLCPLAAQASEGEARVALALALASRKPHKPAQPLKKGCACGDACPSPDCKGGDACTCAATQEKVVYREVVYPAPVPAPVFVSPPVASYPVSLPAFQPASYPITLPHFQPAPVFQSSFPPAIYPAFRAPSFGPVSYQAPRAFGAACSPRG